MALMAASRTPVRRRQRSTRVTVAVSLLSVAAAAVLVSLPTQSALWIGIAAVVARQQPDRLFFAARPLPPAIRDESGWER